MSIMDGLKKSMVFGLYHGFLEGQRDLVLRMFFTRDTEDIYAFYISYTHKPKRYAGRFCARLPKPTILNKGKTLVELSEGEIFLLVPASGTFLCPICQKPMFLGFYRDVDSHWFDSKEAESTCSVSYCSEEDIGVTLQMNMLKYVEKMEASRGVCFSPWVVLNDPGVIANEWRRHQRRYEQYPKVFAARLMGKRPSTAFF